MRDAGTLSDGSVGSDSWAVQDVTTRAEFGALLTELRLRSESTLRELASAVDSSPSTLSGWCRAENLPFPAQYGVFRQLLEELGVVDVEPWMQALVRVRDSTAGQQRNGPPPYRGLQSFGQADADLFFGRTELLEHACARFRALLDADEQLRLLMLVGASGSGKSSLLHAGLCPRLEQSDFACSSLTPGARPVQRLATVLSAHLGADADDAVEMLQTDPAGWLAAQAPAEGGGRLALVVDQFEELFTACTDHTEREAFLSVLEALAAPGGGCPVIVGLRIDFYADLVATGHLESPLQDAQVLVGPMDTAQLTSAIVEPARQAGWSIDDDLVALLLRDFVPSGSISGRHDAGALPLLSHALLETWHSARKGRLTVADYHAAGGIHGAVEQSAERVFEQLPSREQALARQVFLRLVHVGGDAIVTRRAASYRELDGLADAHRDEDTAILSVEPSSPVAALLDRFVTARLLTAHESTVEITHERLLTAWPRLRDWIEEARDALRAQRKVAEATRIWTESGRDPSTLAHGPRLEEMRTLASSESPILRLSRDEHDFVAASSAREAEVAAATRRRAVRLRVLAAAAAAFALLAGSLALIAGLARSEAVTARDEALSRQMALTAERLRDTDPPLAAQLAVAGYGVAATSEARSALLDSATHPSAMRYLGGAGPTALAIAEGGLTAVSNATDGSVQLFVPADAGHDRAATITPVDSDAEVYALALTPDGRTLAVGDTRPAVSLWDVSDAHDPQRLAGPLEGPDGPVQGLAVAPGGAELAAVGAGEGVFRWDIRDPAAPRQLALLGSPGTTWSLAYSPDGEHVAFGDDTGAAHLWTLGDDPTPVAEMAAGENDVISVAFSPDGGTLAAGSRAGHLRAWDVSSKPDPVELDVGDGEFDSWVNTTRFSPDGRHLLAGSSDTDLRVWDTDTWTLAQTLSHPAAVTEAVFTDGGDTIASVATDGTLRLWDRNAGRPLHLPGNVWSIDFTADSARMAAFSGLQTRLWDVTEPALPKQLTEPLAAPEGLGFSGEGAMSPDGTLLAHGTVSGDVVLFDVSEPDEPRTVGRPLGGSEALVEAVVFNADGSLLAAGGDDASVRVWDMTEPRQPRLTSVLEEPTEMVLNLAWHPRTDLLAAPSADGHVYLFDVNNPDEPKMLARPGGFDSEVYAAAFSPHRQVLAAAGSDSTVILWDLTDPSQPRRIGQPIAGPAGRIFDLDFHPSGNSLAAAVGDGSTWVWDTSDPAQPIRHAVFRPTDGQLFTVTFDPLGDVLVASGADSQLWRWPTDEQAVTDRICTTAGDPITEDEWDLYVPGKPYAPPCETHR